MKAIPIKNITLLQELDKITKQMLKLPWTFNYNAPPPAIQNVVQSPNLTFSKLEEHKADSDFVGYPKEYNMECKNYQWEYAYVGARITTQHEASRWEPLVMAPFANFRTRLIRGFQILIPGAESKKWYYDTIGVQPPHCGFQGWSNSKHIPRHSIRFVWNSGSGFSRGVADGRYTYIPDQKNIAGSKHWTCITNSFDDQGDTWFADRNTGRFPRVVFDVSIPSRYNARYKEAVNFIQKY